MFRLIRINSKYEVTIIKTCNGACNLMQLLKSLQGGCGKLGCRDCYMVVWVDNEYDQLDMESINMVRDEYVPSFFGV